MTVTVITEAWKIANETVSNKKFKDKWITSKHSYTRTEPRF